MLYDGPEPIVRVFVVGTLAYVSLVLMLRISGKRTLSKLNAFDLVVTVAIGSTLATTLLSRDVSLVEGVAALGLLIGLQFLVTWSSVRWGFIGRVVKAEARLVVRGGQPLDQAMRAERLTRAELEAAARQAGRASLAQVDGIVLETDGTLSVVFDEVPGVDGEEARRGP